MGLKVLGSLGLAVMASLLAEPCQYLYFSEWQRGGERGNISLQHNNNNTEDHYSHIDTTLNLPIQLWGGRGRHTLYVLILSILALSFSKCVLSLLHQLISPRDTPRPVRTFVKGTRHTQYTSKVHSQFIKKNIRQKILSPFLFHF